MTKSDAQNKKKGEKNQPLAPTYLSSIYLEYVKLTNFGKFANMIVGPFKPGLNVVYGANEAGKTTISELIKNVMFGWRASRRGSNSYKPENQSASAACSSKTTARAMLKRSSVRRTAKAWSIDSMCSMTSTKKRTRPCSRSIAMSCSSSIVITRLPRACSRLALVRHHPLPSCLLRSRRRYERSCRAPRKLLTRSHFCVKNRNARRRSFRSCSTKPTASMKKSTASNRCSHAKKRSPKRKPASIPRSKNSRATTHALKGSTHRSSRTLRCSKRPALRSS